MALAFVDVLKEILRAKKITYKIIAEELAMSESGVKKMLSGKDLSLKRVEQISALLGLSLGELFEFINAKEITKINMSHKQETALAQNPLLFRIYWYLVVDDKDSMQIQKIEKISKEQMTIALGKLENLDLIRVGRSGRILKLTKGPTRWISQGPLVKKINKDWSESLLHKVLSNHKNNSDEKFYHRLAYLKLTPASQVELFKGLELILVEFARRSQRERVENTAQSLVPVSLLFALACDGFI